MSSEKRFIHPKKMYSTPMKKYDSANLTCHSDSLYFCTRNIPSKRHSHSKHIFNLQAKKTTCGNAQLRCHLDLFSNSWRWLARLLQALGVSSHLRNGETHGVDLPGWKFMKIQCPICSSKSIPVLRLIWHIDPHYWHTSQCPNPG